MLAKVNELNKNAVILLSVGVLAITAVIVTLIATSASTKSSAESLEEFHANFISEYGVKPYVTMAFTTETEENAKKIAGDFSKALKLWEVEKGHTKDLKGNQFYITRNKDESFWIHASYK
jgi:Tfp pilus assembly protein PilV